LVPHLASVAVERIYLAGRTVRVLARTCGSEAACPECGAVSRRVHSRYRRQLADTASGGHEVRVDLQVRRFFCGSGGCARKTFAEQVPGLTVRYGRRTCQLRGLLEAVALALAGRAGARLTGRLACAVSRSTLLRLIRAAADPEDHVPLVLGVDDFGMRELTAPQADDLYELITERAGKSLILTSNRAPAKAHMFARTCVRRHRNCTGWRSPRHRLLDAVAEFLQDSDVQVLAV
jgi:hypothetical protein